MTVGEIIGCIRLPKESLQHKKERARNKTLGNTIILRKESERSTGKERERSTGKERKRSTGKLVTKVGREQESRVGKYKRRELFYLTFNFDIISSLQKTCRHNSKFPNTFHPNNPNVNISLHLLQQALKGHRGQHHLMLQKKKFSIRFGNQSLNRVYRNSSSRVTGIEADCDKT